MSNLNPPAGVCPGVPVGGGSYFDAGQFADGPAPLVAQGERIRIDEEVDVVVDHPVVELPGVLLNIGAASCVKPVVVQYPVNPGPGFDAFIDVLLMKMYRFKDENGTREELDIPAEEAEKAQA